MSFPLVWRLEGTSNQPVADDYVEVDLSHICMPCSFKYKKVNTLQPGRLYILQISPDQLHEDQQAGKF